MQMQTRGLNLLFVFGKNFTVYVVPIVLPLIVTRFFSGELQLSNKRIINEASLLAKVIISDHIFFNA